MLLTVKETATILNVKPCQIYYLVNFFYLDSVRILYDIRITETSLRAYYLKSNNNTNINELLAKVKQDRLQNPKKRKYQKEQIR